MYKIILADNTELACFIRNGTNYLTTDKVDESIFDGNLTTLRIIDEETGAETVLHNAELIQQVQYPGDPHWHICFRELTETELKELAINAKLEYLAMMTDVDMEVL